MSIKTRRWLVALLLVATVAAFADVVLMQAQSGTQAIAQSWVAAMTQEQRVEAAKQLDVYRAEYQRALYAAMTPAQRSEFWRFRLNAYLEAHTLSPEQIAVVSESISITYLPMEQWGEALKAADLSARSRRLLGSDARKFAMSRGALVEAADNPSAVASLPMGVRLRQVIVDTFAAEASLPDCECSTDDDWCNKRSGLVCRYLITVCEPDNWWPGCGEMGAYRCDGMCRYFMD